MHIRAVLTSAKQNARVVEAKHSKEKNVGTKMRRARLVANKDTWQRFVEVETHRQRDKGAPRALAKVQGKVQARAKAKERIEHLKHV